MENTNLAYWTHKSGETYVVETDSFGNVVAASEELHHSEVTRTNLNNRNFELSAEQGEFIAENAEEYGFMNPDFIGE